MTIAERYRQLNDRIAAVCSRAGRDTHSVRAVVVTKSATEAQIRQAVAAGATLLGENRVQVLEEHASSVADLTVQWHMIGHLQRNKVRQVLKMRVAMIHSVDSLRLAQEIDRVAGEMSIRMPVLLEVNAAEEAQKFGVAVADAPALAEQVIQLGNVELVGLMAMAPLTDDAAVIAGTFARTRDLLERIAPVAGQQFRELSMGMSHDFEIAIERGATIIRIGSFLFG